VVFFRGDESKIQRGSGEAPARCVIVVATARQPSRGPVSMVLLHQVKGGVAAARRRRVSYDGGLPGAVLSVSFGSLSMQRHVWRFPTITRVWIFLWVPRAPFFLRLSREVILTGHSYY
jgi:hypothetical protein